MSSPNSKTRSARLEWGATAAAVFATSPALADGIPPGVNPVPLQITLAGRDAFASTTFVALGCSSKDGRHPVAIFKGDGPAECDALKGPAKVYPLSEKDAPAIEQLDAKDMGWGAELQAARDLLKGVAKGNGVASMSAQYRVDKSETGCALTKVGATSTFLVILRRRDRRS